MILVVKRQLGNASRSKTSRISLMYFCQIDIRCKAMHPVNLGSERFNIIIGTPGVVEVAQ